MEAGVESYNLGNIGYMALSRLGLSENDRWAEPLEENFTRVLSQNLSALLRPDRVIRYPWQSSQRPAYQLEIEVLRFELNASQEAQVLARWAVIGGSDRASLSVRESRLTRPVRGKSTEASVAALSEALGDLSREMAETIRAFGEKKP